MENGGMQIVSALKAVVLGIVEGVTEFLPISSTGHLIIVEQLVKLSQDAAFVTAFEVVIQLGAVLAIVVLFWKVLWPWASPKETRPQTWRLWGRVIIGIIPAFIFGFLLDKVITEKLFTPIVVAITLVFYGVVLIVIEQILKRRSGERMADVHTIPLLIALGIGLFQVLALIPGTSRSAATIIGGMLLGLERAAAAEFSFFLAVPVMVGASGLTLMRQGIHFTKSEWALMAIGFIVSFVVALFVVRAFMNFVRKRNFTSFGIYRIGLGAVVIILYSLKVLM
jgi:undecaprenyl-diphosphatase